MDLGSHLIDLLTWILGPIQSLRALCNTQVFRYAVDDSATVLLEFSGGAHGIVEAYFSVPDQAGEGVLEIMGTEGRLIANSTIGQAGTGAVRWDFFPAQAAYDAGQDQPAPAASSREDTYPTTDLYAAQLDYFSRCILDGTPPALNRLEEGVETLEWIEKASGRT